MNVLSAVAANTTYTPVPSLISINFLIPKIPKTDLGSPQIVESDGTLEIAKTSNVPHFYT